MSNVLACSLQEAKSALTARFPYYLKSCLVYMAISIILYFLITLPAVLFNAGVRPALALFFNFATEIVSIWILSLFLIKCRGWFVGKGPLDERFLAGLSGFIVLAFFLLAISLFAAFNLIAQYYPEADFGPQISAASRGMASAFLLIPLSMLVKFSFLYFFVKFESASRNLLPGVFIFIMLSCIALAVSLAAQDFGAPFQNMSRGFITGIADTLIENSHALFVIISGLALMKSRHFAVFFEGLWICLILTLLNVLIFGVNPEFLVFFAMTVISFHLLRDRR